MNRIEQPFDALTLLRVVGDPDDPPPTADTRKLTDQERRIRELERETRVLERQLRIVLTQVALRN